ncbi:MAG: sulfite exporter TauE/SafE family protein [Cyclonatronaceae bacterium]
MEFSFALWYLFPVAILVATIAMSSGIGGAVFFASLFMLGLKLDPVTAVGAALATELFGFSSGMIAYYKTKLIDFELAKHLLMFSIPAAILGVLYADAIPEIVLKSIFAVGLIFIGYQLFSSWRTEEREKHEKLREKEFARDFEKVLTDSKGNVYCYTVCNKGMGRSVAFIGGGLLGMISVGLAELQEYHLMARCKLPAPAAVATSIFIVGHGARHHMKAVI